jgi:hypothetical protein
MSVDTFSVPFCTKLPRYRPTSPSKTQSIPGIFSDDSVGTAALYVIAFPTVGFMRGLRLLTFCYCTSRVARGLICEGPVMRPRLNSGLTPSATYSNDFTSSSDLGRVTKTGRVMSNHASLERH